MKAVGFLWIDIDTPDVANNGAVSFIQVHTQLHPGRGGDHRGDHRPRSRWRCRSAVSRLRDILKSLLTMVVVSSAGVGFAAILIQVADQFSSWIIGQALDADDRAFAERARRT